MPQPSPAVSMYPRPKADRPQPIILAKKCKAMLDAYLLSERDPHLLLNNVVGRCCFGAGMQLKHRPVSPGWKICTACRRSSAPNFKYNNRSIVLEH